MKTKIKQIIKLLLPPLFLSLIRKTKEQNTFEGVYKDFSSIENVTDYDTKDSTNNVLSFLWSEIIERAMLVRPLRPFNFENTSISFLLREICLSVYSLMKLELSPNSFFIK